MSKELEALKVQVQASTDVQTSASILIKGLAAQIEAIKTDPVALQQMADELKVSSDNLGADVVANTPAEEPV